MAKETHTYFLVVDYDEDHQEDLFKTFGSSVKEATAIVNTFVDAVNTAQAGDKESVAKLMMKLIDKGKISGGLLIAFAVHDISTMLLQRKMQNVLGTAIKDIFNQKGDDNFLNKLLGLSNKDSPDLNGEDE